MKIKILTIALLFVAVYAEPEIQAAAGKLTVEELRCEYAENPLGVDTDKPRFSWELQSNQRGQMQISNRPRLQRGCLRSTFVMYR